MNSGNIDVQHNRKGFLQCRCGRRTEIIQMLGIFLSDSHQFSIVWAGHQLPKRVSVHTIHDLADQISIFQNIKYPFAEQHIAV